jgi:uncharacterized protein YndB with AHSA1/START domain
MTARQTYEPGPAYGADIQKNGETWTLVLVRTLRHPPDMVWEALTDPAQLHQWAPFDVDRNLGSAGPVKLSTVGTPTPYVSDSVVKHVDPPNSIEYTWGENEMRWELQPVANGTKLTLWANINRKYIAMGAAGWHIAFDVLDNFLDGHSIPRMAGGDAMKVGGFQRLQGEYSRQFKLETGDSARG